ncbi:MAG TPA: GIY-YIG nuclease family protein [Planctomycetota bacterium]|nr:GIY-YIG nuclease family protein [Planctomycetota bacterium]
MPWIYVLISQRNGKRYIGQTGKEPLVRLQEHNQGSNKWTRENKPFILCYKELIQTRTEAIKREHFLKTGQGRKWLDEHIPR